MVAQAETSTVIIPEPDISHLITEDDTPVDNFGSAKQQRFLVHVLYNARKGQIFVADANVGVYHNIKEPPIVPDFFLSLDVQTPVNFWEKKHRCYLVWEFGKVPEVAIEIVSNQVGGELDEKLKIYQTMRVIYYIVFDPKHHLGDQVLRIFKLIGTNYVETEDTWLEGVNLGLTLWEGEFESVTGRWLRWRDENGNLLLTGDEMAQQERQRAENAENELKKLKEKLRQQGINLQ